MAKYKTFDEYLKGENIIRYIQAFKKCWGFATETAVEKLTTTNSDYTAAQEHAVKQWVSYHAYYGDEQVTALVQRLNAIRDEHCV